MVAVAVAATVDFDDDYDNYDTDCGDLSVEMKVAANGINSLVGELQSRRRGRRRVSLTVVVVEVATKMRTMLDDWHGDCGDDNADDDDNAVDLVVDGNWTQLETATNSSCVMGQPWDLHL